MKLKFQGSDKPTIGVELEFQIIDPHTYDLSPQFESIIQLCEQNGVERIKPEFHQSMVEIDSEIATDVKECREFLKNRFVQLRDAVEAQGLRLASTGTHPFQYWPDRLISNYDRYKNLHEKFQWLLRRTNVYGIHVHVGVPTGDCALAVSQAMIRYLPHLLALSANSPFWQGIDTGMQSSRITIMESFPLAGLPHNISKWEDFEHYYQTLLQVGAIQSIKDIYWFIRPNTNYGTIEFRICDAMSDLSEIMAVVALIQCQVVTIMENLGNPDAQEPWSTEHYWIAPENQWIAARDGLDGMIITDLKGTRRKIADEVLDLTEKLSPIAAKLNCLEELQDLRKIVRKGNGAQRQRQAFAEASSLKEVVAASMQEFCASL